MMDPSILEILMRMKEIAYTHGLVAGTLGKGLKPYLQDVTGVSRDSR